LESLNQILSVIEIDMGFLNSIKSFFTEDKKYEIPKNPGQLEIATENQQKELNNIANQSTIPQIQEINEYANVYKKAGKNVASMIGTNVMKNIKPQKESQEQIQKRLNNLQKQQTLSNPYKQNQRIAPKEKLSFEPVRRYTIGGARHKKRKHRKTIKKHKKQHKKQHK
jgi:chaperonin cofactor prefoldin